MEKQEYVIAFGYGIKEKHFSNRYGDIRVLIAHFNKDGTYYTSTIKSNGGGVHKHYVRFLTENDAQKYIDEKLGSDYTYFKAKESRLLKLLDSNYNMYIGGVTAPVGVQPAEYDKNGDLITPRISTDNIDKDISKILTWSIGQEYYFHLESYFSESEVDKIIEFFLSGLDIDTDWKCKFQLCAPFYIKNITPDDDGINVDLLLKVYFPYKYFKETTTKMEMGTILDDPDENFNPRVNSIRDVVDKFYDLPLNIFINYTDLKDSIDYMWDREDKYPQFKSVIAKIIGERAVESILKLKPGSTNYQNVINLRSEIRDKTLEIISVIRDYVKTEFFIESYKDKTVQDILHDLYEGKIK